MATGPVAVVIVAVMIGAIIIPVTVVVPMWSKA